MPRKVTPTYVLLNQVTLATSASSITFSRIPQNFGDLVIVVNGLASGATSPSLNFNGDSAANYSNTRMFANPSTFNSQAFTDSYGSMGFMSTERSNVIIQIFDYSAIDKHKAAIGRGGNTDTLRLEATRWSNTAAITSITVRMDGSQTYSLGTSFCLYGVVV
jgi:hypothetical protein